MAAFCSASAYGSCFSELPGSVPGAVCTYLWPLPLIMDSPVAFSAGRLPRGSPLLGRVQHRSSAVRCLNMASAAQAEAPGSPRGAGSQQAPAAVRAAGNFEGPHDGCQAGPGNLAACARHTEAELPCGGTTDIGKAESASAAQQPASSNPGQAPIQASAATLEPAVEAAASPYRTSPTCTGLIAQLHMKQEACHQAAPQLHATVPLASASERTVVPQSLTNTLNPCSLQICNC